VRKFADAQETVYAIDATTLEELAPDLVIVQDQCRVCAVRPDDLACSPARTLVLKPETLADCLDDVCRVAEALGESRRGTALRASLQARLDAVRAAVRDETRSAARRPRVAVLEWCAPIMGCGYWIPELVSLAGGEPVLCAPPGGRTPTLASADDVLAARPDVVVFALCGFDIPRAARELSAASGGGGDGDDDNLLAKLRAAGVAMFIADGNGLVNRSGPRLIESAECLAEAAHPALRGVFGHLGRAVQVDPVKPKFRLPGIERLTLKCDEPLSNVAFKFNLRRYTWAPPTSPRSMTSSMPTGLWRQPRRSATPHRVRRLLPRRVRRCSQRPPPRLRPRPRRRCHRRIPPRPRCARCHRPLPPLTTRAPPVARTHAR